MKSEIPMSGGRSRRGAKRTDGVRLVDSRTTTEVAVKEPGRNDNDRPPLRSIVIPWLVLAVVAICAAVWTYPSQVVAVPNASSSSAAAAAASWQGTYWDAGRGLPLDLTNAEPRVSTADDSSADTAHSAYDPSRWLGRFLRDGPGGGKPEKLTFSEDHKPLRPLDGSDYSGFFCATLGLMVAAGGGIGGGGILVPIYILVMGFSPKHAIPLSNITVFGGALANAALNASKRHPLADRPLVDWDLILVMEPLTIAGALIGAFLNKILPETFLVVMLVALLSFTAHNTLQKSFKMYAAETRHMLDQEGVRADGTKESELARIARDEEDEEDYEASDRLLDDGGGDEGNEDDEIASLEVVEMEMDEELKQILEEERETPMMNLMVLVTMFVVVLFINVMKGGGAFPSPLGIKCGSTSFWVANFIMLGWIFIISLFARAYLVRRFELKKEHNYQYVDGDIQWDGRATIVYPLICCFAGFFAGMFGVGGGIVKGPLMLAMGVHPAVSSASSACMILFTSFTATTSFVVFGLLVPDYAFVCLVVGFLATLVGQISLSYLMAKYKRNSYIAFSIGGVVLLSAFLMTIQSLVSMAEGAHHHSGGICGKDD